MTTHRFWNLLLALALGLACGSTALAASPVRRATARPAPVNSAPGLQTAAYRIETNETKANFNTGDFTMPNKVRFFRPGTDAIGDRAQGNSKRGTVSLFGNVVVHDSGNASEASDAAYKGSGPATLTCDQLDVDSKARVYTATGHFHFSQGSRTGSADRATLDRNAGTLHLEGNVHLSDNGSTISANIVDYNLNTKDVQTHGSPTIMTQPAAQAPAAAPRQPPAARHTPAPRRTPPRAATAKPSATPSPKPSGAP
ncbi:MAG TPA: LptA/OstA family protein [Dongiaceae bacterium]|nr:LptA/OstA family protein [Dongiaceae bacterium]